MSVKVFVDGSEGTTGLQIHERLVSRPEVELVPIEPALRKDPAARADCLNAADVAFLCLPDVAARESAALVTNPDTIVIDASTAHRTDPAWSYGLPELGVEYRRRIETANRIANIGCHAGAFLLGVAPLVQSGIVPVDTRLSCFSITGYSGGGKSMIADYEATDRPATLLSPRPYALGLAHKHLPEMRQHAGLTHAPLFNPVVGPFRQGLAVTIPLALRALPGNVSPASLHAALSEAYAGATFVRVCPLGDDANLDGGFLDAQACNGTNRADVMVFGHDEQAVVIVRIDNLGKGASGSAIQCMNLRLGLAESAGLTV
ncbi:N-acetyl-gamma-glutamyl-phosphate reductase [Synoicihabitans lomoniglobus]|uniref:N-acetyl-gamma-glutamyl-phosphate reductase n=1 Tax=Synoicihabitans lomoniglobus TaxID=2909285 RepID=A0AAF0CME0_9BACT|nr:N-acetyl-gamma-glutamyl-phosphate reductase [Opitutaceae bacterium LMO-M01]WED63978.1 N-acetyl-gamma-glutamyl-phosphate reductase [Opitutaceae bacterium LMO-M01]